MGTENYQQHVSMKLEKDYYIQANHIRVVYVKPDYANLSIDVTK